LQINFVKINPSGNTTILILDPLPRDIYPAVASRVMKPSCLSAEQVGFVEPATTAGALGRLQMMGGEFCGNASRGFAAWLTEQRDPGIHFVEGLSTVEVPIEVSGHDGVLQARVSIESSQRRIYSVAISVPVPHWMKQVVHGEGQLRYTLVGFEGIVHAVVWNLPGSEDRFHSIRTQIEKEVGEVEALGVMFYQEETQFLTPIVYVPRVGSLVWESSCGSGSVAVAAALADRDRNSVTALKLFQPGGMVQVSAEWKARVTEAQISGEVSIEAQGVVYVDL